MKFTQIAWINHDELYALGEDGRIYIWYGRWDSSFGSPEGADGDPLPIAMFDVHRTRGEDGSTTSIAVVVEDGRLFEYVGSNDWREIPPVTP